MKVPERLEDVDARWLTEALQAACPGVEVTAVARGAPTAGIAITSRVARLRVTLRPGDVGPTAVVIKLRNPGWPDGESMYQREVRFYQELAARHPLPAPRCFHAEYDDASGGFAMVLEDLGDARPGHRLDGLDRDEASAVLATVAAMHTAWWNSDLLAAAGWPGKAYSLDRAEQMLATFRRRWPELDARGQLPVDDALRAAAARIDDGFPPALADLADGPRTLIHSDLHAENLILDRGPDGLRVVAIDWQNASFAHGAFDLAMVLAAIEPAVLRADLDDLLAGYLARLARPDHAAAQLRADVTTAVRWMLASNVSWYLDFQTESIRDAATVRGHWLRLATALVELG